MAFLECCTFVRAEYVEVEKEGRVELYPVSTVFVSACCVTVDATVS